jgi:hypothetical protein
MMDYAKSNDCIVWIHPWQNERQHSVNDSWSRILDNLGGNRLRLAIDEVLNAIIGKTKSETLPAPSGKLASMEHQQFLVMYLGYPGGRQVAHCHKCGIGCLHRQKRM